MAEASTKTTLTEEQKLKNIRYIIQLTVAAAKETQPPEPTDDIEFKYIYKVCKMHKIANTVFYAIEKINKKPSGELYKKWRDDRNMDVHRFMVQTMEAQALREAFNKNGIDFMPIKGFPVCELYPEPNYRYMGDLDYLLREKDLKKAGVVVSEMGYKPDLVGKYHHDEYKKHPLMVIELHHSMIGFSSRFFNYYEGFLDKGKKVGGHEYKMSDEDLYIFQIIHLYKHYEEAGSGIRSFMDMYLMNKKLLPKLDNEYISAELDKLGLSDFVKFVERITDKWFERVDLDELSEDEMYIINSGVYGAEYFLYKNRQEGKTKGQLIRERLFPSVGRMKEFYPIVRKSVVFLPAAYVHRFFHGLTKKRKEIRKEIKTMKE